MNYNSVVVGLVDYRLAVRTSYVPRTKDRKVEPVFETSTDLDLVKSERSFEDLGSLVDVIA